MCFMFCISKLNRKQVEEINVHRGVIEGKIGKEEKSIKLKRKELHLRVIEEKAQCNEQWTRSRVSTEG